MEIVDAAQAGATKPHHDPVARAVWLAAVHASMRASGGTVTTPVEEPAAGRNYYRVGVRLRDGVAVGLLFNAAALLVAAAEPQDRHSVTLTFVNVPAGNLFSEAGLRVATAAELIQPLGDSDLRFLTEDERRDAAYHRPDRLGDLLFNWFD
ncbi:hypothetical protein [Micromonospora carbonacea]|uniref:Uncharacterized protein n=1 Tax=Micromonospora carbonacea TaxID=47853 RepID=A0A1C4V4G8_9ACTN|nr:hypothetical protein [Micromonospora carbonacea]SCE78892.1 hypothetical protein GA0070563_10226 [Micromonospora carbonacea]